MKINERIDNLRKKMIENGIDAYYIPTSDPHQCEYVQDHYKSREYISGFTGSQGSVVITKDEAILWTDGRYFLQAEKELEGSEIKLYKMGVEGFPTVYEYLKSNLKENDVLGMNGKIVSVNIYSNFDEYLSDINFVLDKDLVGEIWGNRPIKSETESFLHDIKYTGLTAEEKISLIRSMMDEINVDATLIGALEDVCYLYNVRANDVKCNPFLTAYAYINKDEAIIYVNTKQLTHDVIGYLVQQGIIIKSYEEVYSDAQKYEGKTYIDPSRINILLRNAIENEVEYGQNLSSELKCIKNAVEIDNIRNCMIKDGVAVVKILKWIEDNIDKNITEWDISEKLLYFRSLEDGFIEDSFETIAGFGPNGAIVHYKPEKDTSLTIKREGLLLIDSGGQYLDGTTDITRTIALGDLKEIEKEHYTLVLKAHIQLAKAKFLEGTTGYYLDGFARKPIWEKGLDYKHGTGHGVGYVLGVHEGPQYIGNRISDIVIQPGMITSNEPGIYIENSHGIRIESCMLSKEYLKNEFGNFMEFETVTICPIDTKPIIIEMMNKDEIEWLNKYNELCREKLYDLLDKEHKIFIDRITKKI